MKAFTKMLRNSIIFAFAFVMALSLGLALTTLNADNTAYADQEVAPAYSVGGWTEYGGASVSCTTGGITMKSGVEGYSFSNTSKKAYNTNDLSISLRLKDYTFDPSGAATNFFIGLTATDANLAAEDGSSYGVALMSHTDNKTFNAWLVKRNKDAVAIPGWDNLALVGGNNVTTTESGVLTISFHMEGNGQWYIWINGIYQIQATAEANAYFSSLSQAHVAVVAQDNFGGNSQQKAAVEVFAIGSDVLGKINENTTITNRVPTSSYEVTENGVVFSSTTTDTNVITDITSAVSDSLVGKLDGAVLSVKRDVKNAGNHSLDIGIGTYHEAGRFTFWDSFSDQPGVAGSFGMRIAPNNTITFLMLTRSATAGCDTVARSGLYGGAMGVPVNVADEYVIQFVKVEGVWRVLVNGRWIYSNETSSGDFHNYLNVNLESLNNATGENVAPWLMLGDASTSKTEGFSATVTVKGYGTQRWGKLVDVNEGVIGDEINGEIEFNKNDWTSITPEGTAVDVKITDAGFVLKGKNTVTGFGIGMNYKKAIEAMDGYAVTVKLPETVLQSGGATHGWYGMFIGDATNANFADLNSVYIRWKYNSTSSATVAIGDIIVWQKGAGPVASTSIAVPVKEAAAGEVTVRFVYNTEDNAYRVYMNGARVTTPTVEVAMTAHLNAMENKYLTVNGSYETDGVGGAWLEGDESVQEITIVSIGGKKVVNKAPELVTNAIAITGTVTHESVTLNWEKAEYPNGAMDSYNFVAVGYVIERYNLTDEDPEATITVEGGIETLTYTDTGLNAESRYFYNVYAVDAEGNRLMASSRKAFNTEEAPQTESSDSASSSVEGGSEGTSDVTSEPAATSGCVAAMGVSGAAFAFVALAGIILAKKKRS